MVRLERCRTLVAFGLTCALAGVLSPAEAGSVNGSIRWFQGPTDSDGLESDLIDGDGTLSWRQPITPWLSTRLFYRYSLERTETDLADFERRSSDPAIEITYGRPKLNSRLSYRERRTRTNGATGDLDIEQLLGSIGWRPDRGPTYSLNFRDESNQADAVATIGRETSSRSIEFNVLYEAETWELRYGYEDLEVENDVSGFGVEQNIHELRINYGDRFHDGRLAFDVEGRISRVDQTETVATGTRLAEPVRARAGLYAVDATPDFGQLDPRIDLIDGETLVPGSPTIDIGGASTFRNLGLDLGVTRPVSQLEITVDRFSSPSLIWEVYESNDNLNWGPVVGVMARWDDVFLRYTLEFPQTVNRYFKAVNVTVNALPTVAVTEVRALIEVDQLGRNVSSGATYQVDLSTTFQPNERVRGTFSLYLRNDDDASGSGIRRGREEIAYNARVSVDIREELQYFFGYLFADFDEALAIPLQRTERLLSTGLNWNPLPMMNGQLTYQHRDETERSLEIRQSDSLNGRLTARFYEGLSLMSDVGLADVEDPFSGFTQQSIRWGERLEAQPNDSLRIGGGVTASWFDSDGLSTVDRRLQFSLYTTWQVVPYLLLSGNWDYGEDDIQENRSQRYSLSWRPGPKLGVSLNWQGTESPGVRRVTSSGGNLSYRIGRRIRLSVSGARSRTQAVGMAEIEVTSARVGLLWNF